MIKNKYFEQFGEIIDKHKCTNCMFIVFKTAASAAIAISINKHRIDNEEIGVKAAHIDNQHELLVLVREEIRLICEDSNKKMDKDNLHVSSIANQEMPSKFLNMLNDDCLQEIFRLLSLDDFCSVADVCTRFRNNAKILFAPKFADVIIAPFNGKIELERLFRNFGSFIKSIAFNGLLNQQDYNEALLLLATYCSTKRSKLEKLTLNCIGRYIRCHTPFNVNFPLKKFEKLEMISLKYINFHEESICKFFQLNQQIKKFHVYYSFEINREETMFRIVNTHLTGLKELKIVFPHEEFDMAYDLKELVKNVTPIETLHLSTLSIDDCYIFPRLSKLKGLLLEDVKMKRKVVKYLLTLLPNLDKLHVKNIRTKYDPEKNEINEVLFTKDDILETIKIPNKLTYLSLQYQDKFILNTNDFETISKIVKNRNNGAYLTVKIGKHCKLNVSDDIIKRNEQWLRIENDSIFGEIRDPFQYIFEKF